MTDLKLGKLPDRTPIKLTIMIMPELHTGLHNYAAAYAKAYGAEEPISALIPAMLAAFLASDRQFSRMAEAGRKRPS